MICKLFFFASLLATAATLHWRLTTWTASVIEPNTDLPTLILLGILAHFAFKRAPEVA